MNHEQKQETENTYGTSKKYLRAKQMTQYLGIELSIAWLFIAKDNLKLKKVSVRIVLFNIFAISIHTVD